MSIPHVILRIEVEGRAPSSSAPERMSTLLIVSQAEHDAGLHLEEALHRARLRGLLDAQVVEVRTVSTSDRPHRPLRRRRTRTQT
jgi:hypothetical protein